MFRQHFSSTALSGSHLPRAHAANSLWPKNAKLAGQSSSGQMAKGSRSRLPVRGFPETHQRSTGAGASFEGMEGLFTTPWRSTNRPDSDAASLDCAAIVSARATVHVEELGRWS